MSIQRWRQSAMAMALGLLAALAGCSITRESIQLPSEAESKPHAAIVHDLARLDDRVIRIRWTYPSEFDGGVFVISRRGEATGVEVVVGRVRRAALDESYSFYDRWHGGFPAGSYSYRVELRGRDRSIDVMSASIRMAPSLVSRLARQLLARKVAAVQLNEWSSRPTFEDEALIPLEKLGIPEWSDVLVAIERADVELRERPPIEEWRIDSIIDWELRPWVSRYVSESRYRLLRVWTVTLRRGDAVLWRRSEVTGYGIERTGAPYYRARRWPEDADVVLSEGAVTASVRSRGYTR